MAGAPIGSVQSRKKLIQYAGYKSSGVTESAARKVYGFENMLQREKRIEECIADAWSIYMKQLTSWLIP